MILTVMNKIFAIAYGRLKNSELQQGLNVSGFIAQLVRILLEYCISAFSLIIYLIQRYVFYT